MKTISLTLALTLSLMVSSFAQECGVYFPAAKATYEFKLFEGQNKKPAGKFLYQITAVETTGNGAKGFIKTTEFKKNGKPVRADWQTSYSFQCGKDNTVVLPDSSDMPLRSLGGLVLPVNMKEGQTSAKVTTNFFAKGDPQKKVGFVEIYNFVVKAKESVTVAAGTFEASVVEYDWFSRQGISIPIKMHFKEWYVPGKGLVKSEHYFGKNVFLTVELASVKSE